MSSEHLKAALSVMRNSGSSEAKAISELIEDVLPQYGGSEHDAVAASIADEFIGWAHSIKFATNTLGDRNAKAVREETDEPLSRRTAGRRKRDRRSLVPQR